MVGRPLKVRNMPLSPTNLTAYLRGVPDSGLEQRGGVAGGGLSLDTCCTFCLVISRHALVVGVNSRSLVTVELKVNLRGGISSFKETLRAHRGSRIDNGKNTVPPSMG